jgi:short-chain fatty acids transporter
MLRTLGSVFSQRLQRWIPEPFVIALLLTVLTAITSLIFTDSGPEQVLDHWYKGFWLLLEFGMQVVLLMVTGFAIALSPPISRLIGRLADLARTPAAVYFLVILIGGVFSMVSWGWVVLTAILARELAHRVNGIDYAYLVALVYLSSQPWVGGLSSSIALLLNTEGNFLIETGILSSKIAIPATLGSLLNGLYLGVYFLTVPVLMWMMRPHDKAALSIHEMADSETSGQKTVAEEAASHSTDGNTPSDRLNSSVVLQFLIAIPALLYVFSHFYRNGFDLNLNIMIFLFISIGMLAHRTPLCFVIAMKRACSNVSGIVFQYPFYAGIMGIMMFSGLGTQLADTIAGGASLATLPFLSQLAGAVANFAIPSAGGEWAVIGPALTDAAVSLSADLPPDQQTAFIARIAMAAAYGETSTNLMQPFFMLLVLPVMGAGVRIQARDVMGYLVIPFLYLFLTTALLVSFVPL